MTEASAPEALLIFAGIDPSGAAGVVADVQTAAAFGHHSLVVPTTLTAQSLSRFEGQQPISPEWINTQTQAATRDFHVTAVKMGALPSIDVVRSVATLVGDLNVDHVVVDPVLLSSSGHAFAPDMSLDAYLAALLPLAPVITPNRDELRALTAQVDANDTATGAHWLLEQGAAAVLVTDGEGPSERCHHELFLPQQYQAFRHERLSGRFRGTGCTLSTALAAGLASAQTVKDATADAIDYTLGAIRSAAEGRDAPGVTLPQRWRNS